MQRLRSKIAPALLCALISPASWAQWTKEVGQRGFVPGAAFDVSTVDSVDTVNGNVVIRVPLASLPAGHAGSGASVTLRYNSGMYDSRTDYLATSSTTYETATALMLAGTGDISGVWSYGYNYGLLTEYRTPQPVSVSQGPSTGYYPDGCVLTGTGAIDTSDSSMSALYPLQIRAIFPDGSSHVLVLANSTAYALSDGWSAVNSLGSSPDVLRIKARRHHAFHSRSITLRSMEHTFGSR
jgi:hypothetical protein